jgi:hypothetical protein
MSIVFAQGVGTAMNKKLATFLYYSRKSLAGHPLPPTITSFLS